MYILTIDKQGADAIRFVGYRYAWSNCLLSSGYHTEGTYTLSESEAWSLREAIESDMEGGHNAYPMLDPRSTLAESLNTLYMEIV